MRHVQDKPRPLPHIDFPAIPIPCSPLSTALIRPRDFVHREYLSSGDQPDDTRRQGITVLPGHIHPPALRYGPRRLRVGVEEEIRIRSGGQAARVPSGVGADGEEFRDPRVFIPGRVDEGGYEFETLGLLERGDRVWARGGSGDGDVPDDRLGREFGGLRAIKSRRRKSVSLFAPV